MAAPITTVTVPDPTLALKTIPVITDTTPRTITKAPGCHHNLLTHYFLYHILLAVVLLFWVDCPTGHLLDAAY